MDYDEWGIMTLWEKVQQLGYKIDGCRCFSKSDIGLVELILDLDAWSLVNSIVRPKVLEIWVIVGVVGEDENQIAEYEIPENDIYEEENQNVDPENDIREEENDSEEEENYSSEVELDQFEGSDYEIEQGQVDDQEFVKYTDPEIEYAGEGNLEVVHDAGEGNKRPSNSEVNFSDEERGTDVHLGVSIRPNPPLPELPNPLWLGRAFMGKEDFKNAVKTYGIQYGKELKFKKNDKVRCVAVCTQSDCKWQATCRRDPDEAFWKVTVFNDEHVNCPWVSDNKLITSSLVAKRWKTKIAGNSNWKMGEFRKAVCIDEHHSSMMFAFSIFAHSDNKRGVCRYSKSWDDNCSPRCRHMNVIFKIVVEVQAWSSNGDSEEECVKEITNGRMREARVQLAK
ncbi:PREDICTED: uncharacterized protein LOC109156638 [Ipomoea nil]|uniref:uncharacterized protein LOC109156638 n=1 Tax=Ipomoea nil TaxID=35883 RepID=UPI00090187F0|nr:PREDICTED: uncharacterized protein LOC109156638 [Ipomoea nil]